MANRVHKSLMNAKVGLVFYFISIFLAFFSRRIFLECLGVDFIGLTGTIGSILSFLNLSEVGIGTCIGYFLYKPIEQGDKDKICEIVSLFGWLYRIVGSIILGGAIIISLFFPLIFAKEGLSFGIIYFAFFSIIGSNVIGYFINYRQILLESDQKMYKISIWTKTGNTIKTVIQIILAYNLHNLYIWVSIEFIFGLIVCWILNYVISKEYPWLKTDKNNGKTILKKYPEILTKAKQIVIHRLKNFFLSKSDEMFIFAFESLRIVTYYGNYIMIVGKLTELVNNVLMGMNASIGNLVAEGDMKNTQKVFWEFITFRYWTAGIFVIGLSFLINPVITWWLGVQYVLADHIVFLILLNMYIMLTRPSIDLFINAYGLYDDIWAAYGEGIINITITIIIGYFYGLIGILLGKTISMIFFAVSWKPYYLYKKGFHTPLSYYWRNIIIHYILLLICLLIGYLTNKLSNWSVSSTNQGILLYSICRIIPIITLFSLMIFLFCPGAKSLIARLPKIRNNVS